MAIPNYQFPSPYSPPPSLFPNINPSPYNNPILGFNNQYPQYNQQRQNYPSQYSQYNQQAQQTQQAPKKNNNSLLKGLAIFGTLGALKGSLLNWGVQRAGISLSNGNKDKLKEMFDKIIPHNIIENEKFKSVTGSKVTQHLKSIFVDPHIEGYKAAALKGGIEWAPIAKGGGAAALGAGITYLAYRGIKKLIDKHDNSD